VSDPNTILIAGSFAIAVATLVYLTISVPLADAPERGARGLARQTARKAGVFGPFEPLLRMFATHVSRLPLAQSRKSLDEKLVAAGEFRGLTPDEFITVSVLSGLFGMAAGAYFHSALGGHWIPLLCVGLGPMLPSMQLQSRTKERHKSVDRGLPAAIDLASLCMGAGLDFPGAVKHVVANMPDKSAPVREELERLLQELSLGRTRKQALESMAQRIQTDAIKEFVASVVQAEQKGTPISVVLKIQATALRARRSVMAEEAAARAGVMLMLPMLLIMLSILILLMGPLFIQMMGKGL